MSSLLTASRCRLLISVLFVLSYSSLASSEEGSQEDPRFWEKWKAVISDRVKTDYLATPDPWESWNRKVFAFNDVSDRYVLTPVAKSYQYVTPDIVETGVGNVFSNLGEIPTILNNLLQFKFGLAAADTGRFIINSTIGVAGIFDVASPMGLEKHSEDFGQTLGYWGVGAGPYLVMPLLGPLNVRDGIGAFANNQVDLIPQIDHVPTRNQLMVLRIIDRRAGLFGAEKLITGDKYAFIRDAYLQRREYLVNDGEVTDSFGEEDFDDDWDEEF